jgi:hypothetical protein
MMQCWNWNSVVFISPQDNYEPFCCRETVDYYSYQHVVMDSSKSVFCDSLQMLTCSQNMLLWVGLRMKITFVSCVFIKRTFQRLNFHSPVFRGVPRSSRHKIFRACFMKNLDSWVVSLLLILRRVSAIEPSTRVLRPNDILRSPLIKSGSLTFFAISSKMSHTNANWKKIEIHSQCWALVSIIRCKISGQTITHKHIEIDEFDLEP